uniref:Putative secreted protein n=1 Tax=Panstrongylus lignarius TaxID=156445 RepID=A0A224XTH6_9HEMI
MYFQFFLLSFCLNNCTIITKSETFDSRVIFVAVNVSTCSTRRSTLTCRAFIDSTLSSIDFWHNLIATIISEFFVF